MTQRERVRTALAFHEPDRIPFSWGLGPTPEMEAILESFYGRRGIAWKRLRFETEHVLTIQPRYAGSPLPAGRDVWGIRRRRVSYGAGAYNEFESFPLAAAASPAEIHGYAWPSADWFDFDGLRAAALAGDPGLAKARRLAIGVCGNPFEIYSWLTGLEQALINLLQRPEVVAAALAEISGFFKTMLERAAETCADLVDVLYFADDVGGQQAALISIMTYKSVLASCHAGLIACGKRLFPSAKAMLHSDGAVVELLPALIEAGVEVLEAVQVDAAGMDPAALKRGFGGRLAFHGGVSVQDLLPRASPEEVRRSCRDLARIFGAGGGYIAAPTHCIQVGTPPENVEAMLETLLGEEYERAMAFSRLK